MNLELGLRRPLRIPSKLLYVCPFTIPKPNLCVFVFTIPNLMLLSIVDNSENPNPQGFGIKVVDSTDLDV